MNERRPITDIGVDELEELRGFYEGNAETVKWICERYRIGRTTVRKLVIRNGWRQRHPRRIDRTDIIERLMRLLEKQITQLEMNMTKTGAGEAAVLGRLVNALEKLIDMKKADAPPQPKARRTKEISDIKARLIERIEQLKRG